MEPRVEASIVVAVYNEEPHVRACLQSIFDAEPFAASFEVLVVDGGSSDATSAIVREIAAARPEVRLLVNPRRFAPHGFNIGIRASRGDFVFLLGGHSHYDPSYFRLCLETARATGAANVGGRVVWTAADDSLMGRAARAIGFSRFGFGASPYRRREVKGGPSTTAVFGCFPRSTFERFGLFDERLTLNQDWELNQRIVRGGGVVWLNPDIRVYYHARQTPSAILRRAWDTGRWVAYMWKVAPYSATPRHAVPAAFVAAAALPGLGALALAAHQAVAVAAAAVEAVDHRDPRLALVLPPLFLGLHGAYGAGTLCGLAEVALHRAPVSADAAIEYLAPRPGETRPGGAPRPGRRPRAGGTR